ncbi:MAG: MBL fold metallo-hydrolase [Actinomycetota bacterium]|nr:MBL fold metallo-hydrolase [Actinomycetota bacterium]
MKITRFGHSAVLVEMSDKRILIDPGNFSSDAAFTLTDLAAIVVTHQHPDHIDMTRIPRLLETTPDTVLLADPQTVGMLETGAWLGNADGKETLLGDVTIRGVGSTHAEITPQLPRVNNVGVVLSAPAEPSLFHPGDTYEYAPADVDVLALPLSAPWAKVSETIDFVLRVGPRTMFPIHDRGISDPAYPLYWGHTTNFGGVEDARKLGQAESTEVEA